MKKGEKVYLVCANQFLYYRLSPCAAFATKEEAMEESKRLAEEMRDLLELKNFGNNEERQHYYLVHETSCRGAEGYGVGSRRCFGEKSMIWDPVTYYVWEYKLGGKMRELKWFG
jgi:hypothetical protein